MRLNPAPGSPALPVFSSVLPVFSSVLPAVDLPLSTSGLASALRLSQRQGVPKPAVIHFNNCFNMSVEHLHTVAPHADYATGYGNYNFFTSGTAYPLVFRRLRQAGIATREALAQWFADENGLMLRAKGNHPTIGGVVRLAQMKHIAAALDEFCRRPGGSAAARPCRGSAGGSCAHRSGHCHLGQQYDSEGDYTLDVPDQSTDLGSLAVRLQQQFPAGARCSMAQEAAGRAARGWWQCGDSSARGSTRTRFGTFAISTSAWEPCCPTRRSRGAGTGARRTTWPGRSIQPNHRRTST